MAEAAGGDLGVRVGLLGPVRAERAGRSLDLGQPQQQVVLAVLAARAGTVVTRGELVDAIWEQAPASAAGCVHKYISALRAAAGPTAPGGRPVIVSACGGYLLAAEASAVDAVAFARDRAAARQAAAAGDDVRAVRLLEAALGLWRGTALCGLPGPWAAAARDRLAQARVAAIAEHAAAGLRLGRHAELADQLSAAVAAYPLDEELRSLLMVALYRSGHRTAAMAAYHHACQVLRDQLAITPGPRLRGLYQQLLLDDSGLSQPPAA